MMKITMKKEKEEIYNDSWIYILLLTTLVILLESLKNFKVAINGTKVTYAIFLLPLVYLLTNYILKKYDYKKAIAAISLSATAMVVFMLIMSFALRERFLISSISGEFCGYVASQFISLTMYSFLLNNTKSPIILIYLNYIFALLVFYMFYTIIYLDMVIVDKFWAVYFVTIGIQSVICIPLAIIDKKIKRGREIIK